MAVTIKDVAKAAGVSTATVSKVINNSPSIPDTTAERIKQIMKELSYHPNLRAQNFAKQSTHNILFVANLKKDCAFENPHMFEIMSGLQKTLSEKGYTLSLMGVTEENRAELIAEVISQKSVDGLVIHVSVVNKELETIIKKKEFPHIVIGCPDFSSQLSWIDNNNYLSGEIAAKHLFDCGYKRIAFIGGETKDKISDYRLKGAMEAAHQYFMKLEQPYIKRGPSTTLQGSIMMEELLSLPKLPEAVICANNYVALGAVGTIYKADLKIPNQIAVITFDDYPFSRITRPELTTVNIDVYDLGQQAGKLIIKRIKKPNIQIQTYTTLPSLMVRGSTLNQGKKHYER